MKKQQLFLDMQSNRVKGLGYELFTPDTTEPGKKYPLILFLHGAGERGNGKDELARVEINGVSKYVGTGAWDLPAFVAAPQCPNEYVWPDLTTELGALLDEIQKEYPIDVDRVTVTGLSMGGYGTFSMGIAFPGRFAALAPICGGGISWMAGNIGKTPTWIFHGDADGVVPVANSLMMYDTIRNFGGNVELTLLHGVDHGSWDFAYERTRLIDWLLAAKR